MGLLDDKENKNATELRRYFETEEWGRQFHIINGSVYYRIIYIQGRVSQTVIQKH